MSSRGAVCHQHKDYPSLNVTSLLWLYRFQKERDRVLSHRSWHHLIFICYKIWLKTVRIEKDTIAKNCEFVSPSNLVPKTSPLVPGLNCRLNLIYTAQEPMERSWAQGWSPSVDQTSYPWIFAQIINSCGILGEHV